MRITKQTIYCTLAVLFLLIAVVCGYLLLDSQHQKDEGRSAFRELASAVNEAQTTKQETVCLQCTALSQNRTPTWSGGYGLKERRSITR